MRIGLIGFGAIGQALKAHLANLDEEVEITGALVRSQKTRTTDIPEFHDLDNLLETDPDLIVECAGHEAMATHVLRVLSTGREVLTVSIGALAEAELENTLRLAAKKFGGKLNLSCGALPGANALSALRVGGLTSVSYRSSKPPSAWGGHAKKYAKELELSETPIVLRVGTAREIALQFSKNANVVGAVAFAGLGWDQTQAELLIDPGKKHNEHYVRAESLSGAFELTVSSVPSPGNPRTSALTAQTLVSEILRKVQPISL